MKKQTDNKTAPPLCQCGCKKPVTQRRNGSSYNSYILGHNPKRAGKQKPSNNGISGRFQPGNTHGKGRPAGSRNKVTLAAENMFEGEAEALSRQCIELALNGNIAALKICIDRISPVKKSVPIRLPGLPEVESVSDASLLTGYLLTAVSEGRLSPLDAEVVSRSAERHLRALQVGDLEQRLSELEAQLLDSAGE